MISRKDYIYTSEVLNNYLNDSPSLIMQLAHDFADYFAMNNERFNYDKFINTVAGDYHIGGDYIFREEEED